MSVGTNVFMAIIGLLILIIHRVVLIITFPNRFKLRYTIGALLIALVLTNQFRNITGDIIQWNSLTTFFNCILMCWLLKGSVSQIFFAFYFQYNLTIALLYLSEALVGILINPVSKQFYLVLFVVMLMQYTVLVTLAFKYGKRLFQRLLEYERSTEWALYASGAVYSFILLTVSRDFPGSRVQYIMSILFVVLSFAVFCFAIINAHGRTKQRYEAEFAQNIISTGRDHYQKMDEMYNKLRILRHDYKYHLNAARKMLGSGDAEGTDKYLTSVENQLDELEMKRYCSNTVIDALISGYAERCEALNVIFNTSINIPETHVVSNYDLCIILGNLLENAVEACEKLEHGRVIKLETQSTCAQILIMVKNSYGGVVHHVGGMPISAKTNGGFGLRSVREVISRHGGDLTFKWDRDSFIVYAAVRL